MYPINGLWVDNGGLELLTENLPRLTSVRLSPPQHVPNLLRNLTTNLRATLDELRRAAIEAATRAVVPYSGGRVHDNLGAALLLSDGHIVPGVRVESASFSLVIDPVVNAVTTAVALGRTDIRAVACTRPVRPRETEYAIALVPGLAAKDGWLVDADSEQLPAVGPAISPFLPTPTAASAAQELSAALNVRDHVGASNRAFHEAPSDGSAAFPVAAVRAGVELARSVARRARVPQSDFPVGCVAPIAGKWVPGVNVEHPDWSFILCAERNLLGTLASYGLGNPGVLFLSCLRDRGATPCGACRQMLAELVPGATVYSDRGDKAPFAATTDTLLPGSFRGDALRPGSPGLGTEGSGIAAGSPVASSAESSSAESSSAESSSAESSSAESSSPGAGAAGSDEPESGTPGGESLRDGAG